MAPARSHTLIDPSAHTTTILCPLESNAAPVIRSAWVRIGLGVRGSKLSVRQRRTVPSMEAVKMSRPSGLYSTRSTTSLCRRSGGTRLPDLVSQTCALPSSQAVTNVSESGLKAAYVTHALCGYDRIQRPSTASQSDAVLSSLVVMIHFPFGLNAANLTPPECPLSRNSSRPVKVFQTLANLSSHPVTYRVPSGLNRPLLTQAEFGNEVTKRFVFQSEIVPPVARIQQPFELYATLE